MVTERNRRFILLGALSTTIAACAAPGDSIGPDLDAQADATLARLIRSEPAADAVIRQAKGVLIFPEIIKGGLVVGAAGGRGVLRIEGRTKGYFQSTAASYGLQAGITKFGYVMVFLDDASLRYLDESAGWEVGVGPNVTVADEGFARRLSSTTARNGVVVFFLDQKGLFAGAGIEGTKITRIRG